MSCRACEWREPLRSVVASPHAKLWGLCLILHLVAALCSSGFLHPDEHFQVLEAAEFKRRAFPVDDLPWEFPAHMRPWLQPGMVWLLLQVCHGVGLHAPAAQAIVLRVIMAMLGFAALLALGRTARPWLRESEAYQRWHVVLLCTAWFLPVMQARTSSENLSASLFVLGLALALRPARLASVLRLLAAGSLLGLAFHARYQVGIMAAGLWTWMLVNRRRSEAGWLAVGVMAAVAAGLLVDRWGYGAWALAPWNYFRVNIVNNAAARYGVQPWWWYFAAVAAESPPGVGLLLVVAVPLAWWRGRRHPLTWTTLPFFVIHCLIAHKELRFLMPIGPLLPALLLVGLRGAWEDAGGWLDGRCRGLARVVMRVLLVSNGIYLALGVVRPLEPRVLLLEQLHKHAGPGDTLVALGNNPYRRRRLTYHFYAREQATVHEVDGEEELREVLAGARDRRLLVYLNSSWPARTVAAATAHCRVLYQTLPAWLRRFNLNGWVDRTPTFTLLECPADASRDLPGRP